MFALVACPKDECELDEDTMLDLGSENSRINGDLILYEYNGDLSGLTYDNYLSYLEKEQSESAECLTEVIKSADDRYFTAEKNRFIIALLFQKQRMVVLDISSTALYDSVAKYSQTQELPSPEEFTKLYLQKHK